MYEVYLSVNPQNPDNRQVAAVVKILKEGGVVILPTDTIYALACDIYNPKAIDRVCRIKKVRIERSNFSFLCHSLSDISMFTRPFGRNIYKLMNKSLPGPYTFILNAGSEVPSIFRSKKKTIGIRIPDNLFVQKVIEQMGNPLMSTSLHHDDNISAYPTDPAEIDERFGNEVDAVIDGGYGLNIGSTVIDCTEGEPVLVRQGVGRNEVL